MENAWLLIEEDLKAEGRAEARAEARAKEQAVSRAAVASLLRFVESGDLPRQAAGALLHSFINDGFISREVGLEVLS